MAVFLRERYLAMLRKDLIFRNPLRLLAGDQDDIISAEAFGVVLARAGVGKTAFLVQLALDNILRGKNILHISLNDPVHNVSLWYEEVLLDICKEYDTEPTDPIWDDMLRHRFIMTFRVEGFSVPKLMERLTDLAEQEIFRPETILIDGLLLESITRDSLEALMPVASNYGAPVWLAVRTERDEPPTTPGNIPCQLSGVLGLLDVVIQLQPVDEKVHVNVLKGLGCGSSCLGSGLTLDPSTMLIRNK